MARHPSLSITDEQEANLRKLAAYLLTLPADYPDFEMTDFVSAGSGYAHVPKCGTAACAAGHGPHAGIEPKERECWGDYSFRAFINIRDARGNQVAWDWCFGAAWSDIDNTVHGAARRILHLLDHGVPDDADAQRWGELPYLFAEEAA